MKNSFSLIALCLPLLVFSQGPRDSRSHIQELSLSAAQQGVIEKSGNFDLQNRQILRPDQPVEFLLEQGKLNFDHETPFIAFSAAWQETDPDPENTLVFLSTSADGQKWSPWQPMHRDEHAVEVKYSFSSELMFLDRDVRHYRIKVRTNLMARGIVADKLLLNFFSPGKETAAEKSGGTERQTASFQTACPCPLPEFITRQGWNCPQGPTSPSYTTVTHLIVHHSASSNVASDWGAVVLSFWNFHVNTNGWADIGYNWLIDPNGKLYEGRGGGDNVIGAHFCGRNTSTMGVCMIGTFTSAQASEAAQKTLVDLLAWKACKENINPLETNLHASSGLLLNRISGHRDGCSTECPGTLLYNALPVIRTAVRNKIEQCNTTTQVVQIPGLEYLRLIPNPASGGSECRAELSLQIPVEVCYRIYNAEGRQIGQSRPQRLLGVQQIALPELRGRPAGTYTVQWQIGSRTIAQQLVIVP